jgi:hypothetical protein
MFQGREDCSSPPGDFIQNSLSFFLTRNSLNLHPNALRPEVFHQRIQMTGFNILHLNALARRPNGRILR